MSDLQEFIKPGVKLSQDQQGMKLNTYYLDQAGVHNSAFISTCQSPLYLIQNSPAVKQSVALKKAIVKKDVKSKVVQEMAVMVGYNGKIFNNFVLSTPHFTKIWPHQI